ncbi:hypothetical protein RHGRI_021129 [Rhododendron griersonianum]|uniref:Endonuclease V n=1 Tax=Rhododendron griersonianum TaxID=479676 RepID=A0AAV6JM43_9ERIC|nr:hypothetical protein RHGRI_021129 [Rhododendron griersonianum]
MPSDKNKAAMLDKIPREGSSGSLGSRNEGFSVLCGHAIDDLICFELQECFGLACHLGVLANLPTIGIGKNLHHVDGLTQSTVRQLLETKGTHEDILTLRVMQFLMKLMQAMRSNPGSFKPIYISVGHRVSLANAVKIARMTSKYRVPEPIRQADIRSRDYLRKHQSAG